MKCFELNELELKEKLDDSFVRDVVAFLNSYGGKILIGVQRDGTVVGVDNIDATLKRISDIVSNQIEPSATGFVKPELFLEDGNVLISVSVLKGFKSIYCIKECGLIPEGCWIRIGPMSRQMSVEQIANRYKRRFLSSDVMLEKLTTLPELSFHSLKQYYLDKGYRLNDDTFESQLFLISHNGRYNMMGELLSDNNRYSLLFVRYSGVGKSAMSYRADYGKRSLLFAYEQIMNRIAAENINLVYTSAGSNQDVALFDYNCVKEAVVNAIVHNDWTESEPHVAFFSDRLEVVSHGGLPPGISKEEFLNGAFRPRNPKLMKIFSDLGLARNAGHGVLAILKKYGKSAFIMTKNFVMVRIPFDIRVRKAALVRDGVKLYYGVSGIRYDTDPEISASLGRFGDERYADGYDVSRTEAAILQAIMKDPRCSHLRIAKAVGCAPKTVERNLIKLVKKGYVVREGSARGGRWKVLK